MELVDLIRESGGDCRTSPRRTYPACLDGEFRPLSADGHRASAGA